MKMHIGLETTIVAGPEQVSADVGGEAVILSFANGEYYGLNEVGARIWALIEEPRTVGDVCAVLLREYEGVEAERVHAEVLALLAEMADAGLVRVVAATPA
jgi:hypothetical protein